MYHTSEEHCIFLIRYFSQEILERQSEMNPVNETMEQENQPRPCEQEIQVWLITKLAEYLNKEPAAINVHQPFSSYGLQSVNMVGLSGELEDWLQFRLSPTLAYDYPTIALLAHHLSGNALSQHAKTSHLIDRCEQPQQAEPIAIIGLGCRFPGADSPEAFWQLLSNGVDMISEVPVDRWDINMLYDPDTDTPDKMYVRSFGFLQNIDKFDAHFFGLSPREALRMDPQQRLLVEVAYEALERAGQQIELLAGSKTGIFIGQMNTQEYSILQIQSGENPSCINDPYFGIGSASSIASGRIAYLFNLQGPALTIDTACSSSLVAAHLACQSLRNRECNLALAGGVSLILLPESVVNACKMHMLAADGRCKTFDATADGFGMGEGCGIVVLKRLAEALADNDPIQAIILGSAINQDGRSNGITAPNRLAQEEVIHTALLRASIDPQQISYVEAHGTGTALGDPIEIEALANVLGKGRSPEQSLFVGTVKTNIGHLAGAAGIAGLIKTVLALQHRAIPPHLHFKTPNPHVNWQSIPVKIPDIRIPWQDSSNEARFAGVSSFGWSGTNAHMVLTEAPALTEPTPSRPWQLLLLSAHTTTVLDAVTDNIAIYLRQNCHCDLADLAYTLQTGRNQHQYRSMVLCHTREEAIRMLTTHVTNQASTGIEEMKQHALTFMFPGLGDQYRGMTRQLYHTESVFRQAVDLCAGILLPWLQEDIREIIYLQENQGNDSEQSPTTEVQSIDLRNMLRRNPRTENDQRSLLYQTCYAQPALFVIEYALAQLWFSWGIRPQAMIGYSLGEYVAATLADVMSLRDALFLVVKRAQKIQKLPDGAMVAITLSQEQVAPLLSSELSLAILNSSSVCVVAGSIEAIEHLERQLTAKEIIFQRLQTSHAFHSNMMQPIADEIVACVRELTLRPPRIPYISNVTGTWITDDQATDPEYWAKHLCQTVHFASGMETLRQDSCRIFLEVGPGQMLSSLAIQGGIGKNTHRRLVLPSMRHAYEKREDIEVLLRSLGQLWQAGIQIDWTGFYCNERRKYLPIPTTPFEHQRYWPLRKKQDCIQERLVKGKQHIDEWCYVPLWKQSPAFLSGTQHNSFQEKRNWLIFIDDCNGVGSRFIERLQVQRQNVIVVKVGTTFSKIHPDLYQIDPCVCDDYIALCNDLYHARRFPDNIVHAWSANGPIKIPPGQTALDKSRNYGFYSVLFLTQALGSLPTLPTLQLFIIGSNMHRIIGEERIQPENALLLGHCKVIPKEYPQISCCCIDIVPPSDAAQAEQVAIDLLKELGSGISEEIVAYRSGRRWILSFDPVELKDTNNTTTVLRERGIYLITGGLGGLGLALAEYLARTVKARLVLLGRSSLPPREQWMQWLDMHEDQEATASKIRGIQLLEDLGSEVMIVEVDVADEEQMAVVVTEIHERFGNLHGVIHAAGMPGQGFIQRKTPEMVEEVLRPKLEGTLVLDRLLAQEKLDFFLLYSSSTAVTGGLGEVDYCAANAFLDAFACYKNANGITPTIAIGWGPWQWDAWQTKLYSSLPAILVKVNQIRKDFGISFAEGMQVIQRILSHPLSQILVLPQGFHSTIEQAKTIATNTIMEQLSVPDSNRPRQARPDLRTAYVAPRDEIENKLAIIWQEALGIERIGISDHFFELGGNSLIGLSIISRIQKDFHTNIAAASLFEAPTVDSLAKMLRPQQQQQNIFEQNSRRGTLRRERLKKLRREDHRS